MAIHLGFQFSDRQKQFILDQLNPIQLDTGIPLTARTFDSEGFDFVAVSLHQPNESTNPDLNIFTVLSVPGINGVGFHGRKGDGGLLGPMAIYDSFEEAFIYGKALARSVCSEIALNRNSPIGAPHTADEVFSRQDEMAFQSICDAMSRRSGFPAYFDIVPLTANASSVDIGSTNQSGERLPFGSLVKSTEDNTTTVTVRGFNGSVLPDAPQTFPSVDAALAFSRNYFEFMSAQQMGTKAVSPNVIVSSILSPEEVQFIQEFANNLGKSCRLQGYANFMESQAGLISIALGLIHDGKPFVVGTAVVALESNGQSCSVRDFKNRAMPGPQYYNNIYAALALTKPHFNLLCNLLAQELQPSKSRLFAKLLPSQTVVITSIAVVAFAVLMGLYGETKVKNSTPTPVMQSVIAKATLSDVLRDQVTTWNSTSNQGVIRYKTLPPNPEFDFLRKDISEPMELVQIHTLNLPSSREKVLFFSSKPIARPASGAYDCNACLPILSTMLVEDDPQKGLIVKAGLTPLMLAGRGGKISMEAEFAPSIVEIGPKVVGFVLKHGGMAQGYTNLSATVHAVNLTKGITTVGEFDVHSDGFGNNCPDPWQPKDCPQSDTKSKFLKRSVSHGLYDLLLEEKAIEVVDGVVHRLSRSETLKFNGKSYVSSLPFKNIGNGS